MIEAELLKLIKLKTTEYGWRLWRNNVGAACNQEGRFIRYGLANDSTSVNTILKSGDLIGIRPIKITQEMIDLTIGQFISFEIKHPQWQYSGNKREKAQLNWIKLIRQLGGAAAFITSLDQI